MMLIPIPSRGWCDLAECEQSSVAQDCVRFGSVTVCKPCLIDLGGGVEQEEIARHEEASLVQDDRIDKLEEELEKARAALTEARRQPAKKEGS